MSCHMFPEIYYSGAELKPSSETRVYLDACIVETKMFLFEENENSKSGGL